MNFLFLENKLRTDKLGLMYIASVLRGAGHSVDLIQDAIDPAEEYLEQNPVDFVCYSIMSAEAEWAIRRNAELKQRFEFVSVVGGAYPTFFPQEASKYFDRIVMGPGENAILDIVAGKLAVRGEIPDINDLPFPARDIQYKYTEFGSSPMKRFIAGRYCQYSCSYCFNHAFKRLYKESRSKFSQRRSPELMIQEMTMVREQYGLELAYFNDDDIAADLNWLEKFCQLARIFGFKWCGSIRANSVDFGTILMMKRSGCTFLNIALESARPDTQRFLRRGNITNEQVWDACDWCKEVGIKVRLQNMIGLPVFDPLGDALITLEMNQAIAPTDSWVAIYQPYYGTDLYDHCVMRGLIEDTGGATGNFYDKSPLAIENAEEISRLYHWWSFAVQYKIPINLIRILLDIPIPPKTADAIREYKYEQAKGALYGI